MKNEYAKQLYDLYLQGLSLAQVAQTAGVTRQSVYGMFKTRNLPLRTVRPNHTQEFNGVKFSRSYHGYYRRTDGDRELMHRYVWRFYNGEIGESRDVHHVNENKADNRIENLELLTKAEHTRRHNLQTVEIGNCYQCGRIKTRHQGESPSAYRRRYLCGSECRIEWMKGKSKGTKINETFGFI